MTDIQNYAKIVDDIFGAGSHTLNTGANISNNILRALNVNAPTKFKSNFLARLNRIRDISKPHQNLLKPILIQVNEIASLKNWQGAFAELASFDHLNKDRLTEKNFLFSPIVPDLTLAKEKAFALEMGEKEANLDGYIEEYNIYFDIKVLKDNVKEILNGIYAEIKQAHPDLVNISAEYEIAISYGVLQKNRRVLKQELLDAISLKPKLPTYRSGTVPDLSFVFSWEGGVSFAITTHNIYEHAKNHHKNVFIYANKFLKEDPTMIVLVNFPWYNLTLTTFDDSFKTFQRAYSRRIFCQYIHDQTPFRDISPDFNGNESIYEISTHLSGIIFLDDTSLSGENPDETNVECSIYLNPNAKNPVSRPLAFEFMQSLEPEVYDDFQDDNY